MPHLIICIMQHAAAWQRSASVQLYSGLTAWTAVLWQCIRILCSSSRLLWNSSYSWNKVRVPLAVCVSVSWWLLCPLNWSPSLHSVEYRKTLTPVYSFPPPPSTDDATSWLWVLGHLNTQLEHADHNHMLFSAALDLSFLLSELYHQHIINSNIFFKKSSLKWH